MRTSWGSSSCDARPLVTQRATLEPPKPHTERLSALHGHEGRRAGPGYGLLHASCILRVTFTVAAAKRDARPHVAKDAATLARPAEGGRLRPTRLHAGRGCPASDSGGNGKGATWAARAALHCVIPADKRTCPRMARRNRPWAAGIARSVPMLMAPADSPKTVTLPGFHQRRRCSHCTHSRAATWSSRPMLAMCPPGRGSPRRRAARMMSADHANELLATHHRQALPCRPVEQGSDASDVGVL